jgi:very-short-patch-repair endonuclease
MTDIICKQCGKTFTVFGKGNYQNKFCSDQCRQVHATHICVICNRVFIGYRNTCSKDCENILRSHSLKGRCVSEETRQKMSKSAMKRIESGNEHPELNFKKYYETHNVWNAGLTKETDSRIKLISDKIRKTENDPDWILTIGHNKSERIKIALSKQKRSAWNRGLNKYNSEKVRLMGEKISKTYQLTSDQFKQDKRIHDRFFTLKRISTNPTRGKTNTKPELSFKDVLNQLNVNYIHNYPVWKIEHMYPADFYLPDHNLIIEIDGTYWHNFPDGREIDHIRESELVSAGYYVYRIWDTSLPWNSDTILAFSEFLDCFVQS